MRYCECGNLIPSTKKINGVIRNLRRRSKCLECLPFVDKLSEQQKANIAHRQKIKARKSDKKRNKGERRKEYNSRYAVVKFIENKRKAVEYMGGKCKKCGYNKCYAALTFHHIDPSQKEFDWYTMRKLSWSNIVKELNKCIMLCHNCHTEEHYDDSYYLEAKKWLRLNKRL